GLGGGGARRPPLPLPLQLRPQRSFASHHHRLPLQNSKGGRGRQDLVVPAALHSPAGVTLHNLKGSRRRAPQPCRVDGSYDFTLFCLPCSPCHSCCPCCCYVACQRDGFWREFCDEVTVGDCWRACSANRAGVAPERVRKITIWV